MSQPHEPARLPSELFSLAGRRALVTGAASGLGQAIAEVFAGAGAEVYCCDRDADGLATTTDHLGGRGTAVALDVADRAAVERVVGEVGPVDVLVNSAGVGRRGDAASYPDELWDRALATNLTGTFSMCRAVGRGMVDRGRGSVINLASIGGVVGYPGSVGYQASKGGVVQLTKSLAIEWAPRGVRVNAIAPSQFETKIVREQWAREPALGQFFLDRTPLGRFGEVKEICGPALFLATDASAMVTGHVLAVDGGYLAQ